MKHIKKIAALVLALAMVLSISVVAFADDDNVYTGSNDTLATGVHDTTSIPLNKTLVIFNTDDGTQVREPDITFSYTIEKVDSSATDGAQLTGITVTDEDNDSATIYNGVAAGVTAPTDIAYSSSTKVAATTTGYEDEKTTQIGVVPTAFPHAGIFRYIITETTNPTDVTERGLEARDTADTDGDGKKYDSTRYMDVYIKNVQVQKKNGSNEPLYLDASGNETTTVTSTPVMVDSLALQAAVIFKTVETTPANKGKDAINKTFEKTTGFEPGTNGTPGSTDFTNDDTVDRYFTYNLDVTKKITGNLADKGHDFPFQIAITGALAHAVTVDINNNGTASTGNVSTTALNQTADLSDGETYSVTGLPKGTKVTVTEYNNTVDVYKLTTSFAGTTSTATQSNATEGTTLATATGETDVLINSNDATNVKADTKTVLTFTNDLAEISPTGYVVRIAPYVLMLAGGVALLVVTRRRREDAQAA